MDPGFGKSCCATAVRDPEFGELSCFSSAFSLGYYMVNYWLSGYSMSHITLFQGIFGTGDGLLQLKLPDVGTDDQSEKMLSVQASRFFHSSSVKPWK